MFELEVVVNVSNGPSKCRVSQKDMKTWQREPGIMEDGAAERRFEYSAERCKAFAKNNVSTTGRH